MFYYCLSHSSGGAFVEQIGLEEVLFVQKVYIMSTNEETDASSRPLCTYTRILANKWNISDLTLSHFAYIFLSIIQGV